MFASRTASQYSEIDWSLVATNLRTWFEIFFFLATLPLRTSLSSRVSLFFCLSSWAKYSDRGPRQPFQPIVHGWSLIMART